MRTYHQLTQAQQYQLSATRKAKHSLQEIAELVGVHKSSVSRELRRNRGQRSYHPQQAHELATERKQKAVPRLTAKVWKLVENLLKQDWSPEQISGRLKKEQRIRISHVQDKVTPSPRIMVRSLQTTNGLLRQYFPKKSDFKNISKRKIKQTISKLNLRPRKTLRFKTPFEVFYHTTVALTT